MVLRIRGAGLIAGFAMAAALPVMAQQPAPPAGGPSAAPAPVDRGSALYGRPESEGAAKLAPVAPPPLPTRRRRPPPLGPPREGGAEKAPPRPPPADPDPGRQAARGQAEGAARLQG